MQHGAHGLNINGIFVVRFVFSYSKRLSKRLGPMYHWAENSHVWGSPSWNYTPFVNQRDRKPKPCSVESPAFYWQSYCRSSSARSRPSIARQSRRSSASTRAAFVKTTARSAAPPSHAISLAAARTRSVARSYTLPRAALSNRKSALAAMIAPARAASAPMARVVRFANARNDSRYCNIGRYLIY